MSSEINYSQIPDPQASVLKEQGIEDRFIEKLRNLKYTFRSDITDRASLENLLSESIQEFGVRRQSEAATPL